MPPSLVGYHLFEARRRLEAAGWQVLDRLTQPPFVAGRERPLVAGRESPPMAGREWQGELPRGGEGRARVIGQRVEGPGRIVLVYAFERHDPKP